MPQPTPEEEAQYLAAIKQLAHEPPLIMEVPAPMAYLLVANLQLALRAPMNTGAGAVAVQKFVRELEERIAPVGSPIHDIMEMGWDTAHDVPSGGQKK